MLNRFKNVVIGAVESFDVNRSNFLHESQQRHHLAPKFPYARPHFLNLGDEEVQMSADHRLRPIIHPNQMLPYHTGYAECVNAGKSKWNEDQAVVQQGILTNIDSSNQTFVIPYSYYGIFDGHAGVGAALCAANQLHHIVHEKLVDAQDDIWSEYANKHTIPSTPRDLLIVGALESAFNEMDQLIAEDRNKYQAAGGCTALVALFILGRVYVANAGDSRAVICNGKQIIPMSVDFNPENERERIRKLAAEQPSLLGKEWTSREYKKQPRSPDLGKPVMYRDAHMKGWAYKTLQQEDLKMPIISGQGKRSRVMNTIGVTRGFGDHDLLSIYQRTPIKPFLSPHPEVTVHYLEKCDDEQVLILGTDGLWDVIDGAKVNEVISKSITTFMEKERWVSAATCLVGAARGVLVNEHSWQLRNSKQASVDDISVFVIPLLPYKLELDAIDKKAFETELIRATDTLDPVN